MANGSRKSPAHRSENARLSKNPHVIVCSLRVFQMTTMTVVLPMNATTIVMSIATASRICRSGMCSSLDTIRGDVEVLLGRGSVGIGTLCAMFVR